MKKTIFILLSLCLYMGAIADPYSVRFGKGDNCTGYNICAISTSPAREYNEAQVEMSVTKSKHIQMVIQRSALSTKAYLKFFSTGVFVMDGDFVFPIEICTQLKIEGCTIHSGRYEIKEDSNQFVIVF